MSAKIYHLTPKPAPIGHFVRIGSAHHQLATLQGGGRLPVKRVTTEAAALKTQSDFLGSLRNAGVEITLDTRIAELSEAGSHVQSAQWLRCVDKTRPMTPRDFGGDGSWRIASEVAALAVENKVDAVLAPSHFIKDSQSPW